MDMTHRGTREYRKQVDRLLRLRRHVRRTLVCVVEAAEIWRVARTTARAWLSEMSDVGLATKIDVTVWKISKMDEVM